MAQELYALATARQIGCFFYKEREFPADLLRRAHIQLYSTARVRLYLLREMSFQREYTRLELRCGQACAGNIVVSLDGLSKENVPDEFAFMRESGWHWERSDAGADSWIGLIAKALRG